MITNYECERKFWSVRFEIKKLLYSINYTVMQNKFCVNQQAINRKEFYDNLVSLIQEFDDKGLKFMDHVLLEAIEYWKTRVKK